MSKSNRVTLFSNGMGHFTRHYVVKPGSPERISLPFNKNHISDVATSLSTFRASGGQVRYSVPPSFTPTNANSSTLKIDSQNALRSLLQRLSGAEAKIAFVNTSKGEENVRILGIDSLDSIGTNGETVKQDAVSVLDQTGWTHRYRLSEITGIKFTNESVQSEVDKALRQNFQQIKPESTFLELVLEADEETVAAVTYTIPVAAWKMRYGILQEKDKFFLEGSVIVDNNTDEDWDNFIVSVVTGDPISFMTDIAEIKTPQRRMVNLINTNAMGNVDVEEGYSAACALEAMPMAASAGGGRAKMAAVRGASMTRSVSNVASFGMEQADSESLGFENMAGGGGVESKEVGDFCVFTSKTPISIASKKSAVVPMFNVPLTKAGVVLLYKESNHSRRPFRAVKFKNETDHTLGKGKVVLYNDGLLAGECVLETAKPGDNRMLPHCLENGVKIVREKQNYNQVLTAVKLSDSVAVQEIVSLASCQYVIENKKDEEFKVALEVPSLIGDMEAEFKAEGVMIEETEKLNNGRRVYFTLAPKQKFTLNINERLLREQSANIGRNFYWLQNNFIKPGHDLAKNPDIKRCAAIQKKIDSLTTQIEKLNTRSEKLDGQAERLRRNIEAAKSSNAGLSEWVSDLDRMEKECRKIEDTDVPALQTQFEQAHQELYDALASLTVTWKNQEPAQIVE